MALLSGILTAAIVGVHVFGHQLHALDRIPRSRWLSFAGGASVAYVFLHLLPELASHQTLAEDRDALAESLLEVPIYIIALFGLLIFYGLERAARQYSHAHSTEADAATRNGVFWLHVATFAAYNALVGVLLATFSEGVPSMILFALAIGLHFLVNDYGLRHDHRDIYHNRGRWILAGAIAVGWIVGMIQPPGELIIGVLFSFLAGGIVMNTLKEELPEDRKSRFWAFALGVLAYGALLVIVA
jgi:zinc transporter ZupT